MPILLCAGLSLAIALLRGAGLADLATARLRWLALPVVAFGAQLIAFGGTGAAAQTYALWVQIVAGALLLVFVAANLRYRSLGLIAVGTLLNLAPIAANGGYMPVRAADIARIGRHEIASQLAAGGVFQKSIALDDQTVLPWLADVIFLPLPLGATRIVSVGDLLIGVGTFLLIQQLLVRARRRPRVPAQLAHA